MSIKDNEPSLEIIQVPIKPYKFVSIFSKKYQKWGNTITKELRQTWHQNCVVFNTAIANKEKALKYIVSAPTGSAKTENMITYCSMLEDSNVLICTNLIEEADRIANSINSEAGEKIAFAYHSKCDLDYKQASLFQIVVVTHSFYKKNHLRKSSDQWYFLSDNRDLIIIDEALETMAELSLTTKEIEITLNLFNYLARDKSFSSNTYFTYELNLLKTEFDIYRQIEKTKKEGTQLLRSDHLIDISDDESSSVFVKSLEIPRYFTFRKLLKTKENKYNKILTGIHDESNDKKIHKSVMATLEKLDFFRNKQVYTTSEYGDYSFHRIYDYKITQSVVHLDATSDINHIYNLREKYHKDLIKIPRIENVRNYSTVILHVAKTKTGKLAVDGKLASDIISSIKIGKQTLFITHKKNKTYFETTIKSKFPSFTIDCTHWGKITGLNTCVKRSVKLGSTI